MILCCIDMIDEQTIRPNRNGMPAIRGTRLTVYSIMDHYFAGAGLGEISDFYRITLEEASSAVDFINSHMNELMPTYREMLNRDARGNSARVNKLLLDAHGKLIELRTELRHQARAENAPVTG